MDKISEVLKWFTAITTATLTYAFGGVDLALSILLGLITLDYITGLIAAVVEKNLSSEIGYRGIAKKIGILVLVAVGHLVGTYMSLDMRTIVIGYYIANEGISIIENTGRMGVPYPKKFLDILKQLKKDGDGNENT